MQPSRLRESRGDPHLEPLRPARRAGTQASRRAPALPAGHQPQDRMGFPGPRPGPSSLSDPPPHPPLELRGLPSAAGWGWGSGDMAEMADSP